MRESQRTSQVDIRPNPEGPADLATLQSRLYQAERLASLGSLTTGVAHEVNNPLTYVLANLEFILEQFRALTPTNAPPNLAELMASAQDAYDGAERVRVTIRDMHTVSRADTDPIGPTSVRESLESALRLAAYALRARATVERDVRDVPPVQGNVGLLVQVFLNILINAAQAMETYGTIHVRVLPAGPDWVDVEIEDEGEGIAPGNLDRIFDPFFTTRAPGSGSGLGLFAVRGIVTSVGGSVTCESALGEGTLLRVTLPVAPHETTAAEHTPPPSLEPLRVLLVDDEPQVRSALARMLTAHDVTLCDDAIRALALCRNKRFDVLVTDLLMPGMSGRELHERLAREGNPLAGRTVFLTGGAVEADDTLYIQASGGCLYKPVERRALLEALAAARPTVRG